MINARDLKLVVFYDSLQKLEELIVNTAKQGKDKVTVDYLTSEMVDLLREHGYKIEIYVPYDVDSVTRHVRNVYDISWE